MDALAPVGALVRVALDAEDAIARFRDLIVEAGVAGVKVVPAAHCQQCSSYVNGSVTPDGELSFTHDCLNGEA